MFRNAVLWICCVVGGCCLFAASLGCLGGGKISRGRSDGHHGTPHAPPERTYPGMKNATAKPLPNTVVVGSNQWGKLYAPARGYVWRDSRDSMPRGWQYVVPVIRK